MIRIALCDGNVKDRQRIKTFCHEFFSSQPFEYVIQEYTSGESFLQEDFPDVLFLEMHLENINGLWVKEILEEQKAFTRIIFMSKDKGHILQAFGRNVYGFLLKPLVYYEVWDKLQKIVEDLLAEERVIYCKSRNGIEKVHYYEIYFIKSYGRYTQIYHRKRAGYSLLDKSMGEWQEEENMMDFASCHRCYLVNLNFVRRIEKSVRMLDGTGLPIAKEKREAFVRSYKRFLYRKSYEEDFKRLLSEKS